MSEFTLDIGTTSQMPAEPTHIDSMEFGEALASALGRQTTISSHFTKLHLSVNPTRPWTSWRECLSGSFVVLISTEPHVVSAYPRSWLARATNHVVLNLCDSQEKSICTFGFTPWFPEAGPSIVESGNREQVHDIRLVSGALFSANNRSLYNLRLRAANSLVENGYSVGFGGLASVRKPPYATRFRSLVEQSLTPASLSLCLNVPSLDRRVDRVGHVGDLSDFFSRGKLALVIENDARYTSEKLFQALASNVRVVYVGKSLEALGFPEGLVIESEPTIQGIQTSVETALAGHMPDGLFLQWVRQNMDLVRDMTPSACAKRAISYSVGKSLEFIAAKFL